MADYLLMFRHNLDAPAQSPEEMQKHMQKWFHWLNAVKENGTFVAGAPLDMSGGKTIRGKSKRVMDGPFAEVKDVVNGFMRIKAESFEQATEIGKDCPVLDVDGSVEVRVIQEMNMSG